MTQPTTFDKRFKVKVINATPNPQQTTWYAMHQDYSEAFVGDQTAPDETRAGEICVKRLLAGDRGHYGCYSADTLVMTSEGWKAWSDVGAGDLLLAVDIGTGASHFEAPKTLHVYPVAPGARLYSVSSQRLDQLVTHDHRMVVSSRHHDGEWSEFSFKEARDVAGRPVRYRVTTDLLARDRRLPVDRPEGVDFLDVLRLAGFYYGDGVRSSSSKPRCLRFRLRKQRKIDYLQKIGPAVGVLELMGSDRFTVCCDGIASWVERHFSTEHGKTVPEWIVRLPRAYFLAFLEGLRNSDGTRYKPSTSNGGESWALDSVEKDALELIQSAAVLNGIAALLVLNNLNEGADHINHRPCWRLSFNHDRPYARFEACNGRTHGTEEAQLYEGFVYCATVSTGALLVSRNGKPVVSGNCLEHAQIVFSTGWFPHSVMQQARTHRVGVSFDVQSMRYTGDRICKAAKSELPLEEVFYLRPSGYYSDRQGKKYIYTEHQRSKDLILCAEAANRYNELILAGYAEEHARGILPFDYRQHFVVSFSLRSLLHFLDLRWKLDAQLEIRQLCELIWPHFVDWTPQFAEWYEKARLHRARLAP